MNQRSTVARNTAFSSIGIYTEYLLGLLTSIAVARHLGPADLGIYSLVIWLSAVGVALTNSGIATAVIKFVAELRGSGHTDLIAPLVARVRRIQWLFFLVVIAVGAAALLLLRERLPPQLDPYQLLLLIVTIGLRAPYMLNISLAKGFEDFRTTAMVALLAAPTNLALILGAVLLDAGVTGFLEVFAVSSLVFWAVSALLTRRLAPKSDRRALPEELALRLRRHVSYVAVTVSVSFVAASEIEVLFLNLLDSAESAGTFKVAYTLASGAALLLPGVFSAILLPMMASAVGQGGDLAARRLSAVLRYLTLLSAPLAMFGICFGPQIIAVLYGSQFDRAGTVLSVLMASACFSAIAGGANSLLVSLDRQPLVLAVTIGFAVAKCTAAVLAVPEYGLWGGVWSGVIASLVASVATIWLALRLSAARPSWSSIARTVIAAGAAGLIALPFGVWLPPLAGLMSGALLFVPAYAAMTVLLRAWSRDDLAQIASLHEHFAGGRPLALARALRWASARAGGPP